MSICVQSGYFEKKPLPAVAPSLSFMSSSRSDDETEVGMSTLIVTKWSPRPLPPNLGAPLPSRRVTALRVLWVQVAAFPTLSKSSTLLIVFWSLA